MHRRIVIVILALAYIVSCAPVVDPHGMTVKRTGPKSKFKQHEVLFRVKNGVLEPHPSNNKGCKSEPGANKGCVDFEKNTLGVLRFKMGQGNAVRTCATHPQPDYVIVEVKVTDKGSGDKGQFPLSNPAPNWLVEAFPTLDPATGVIYEAQANPPPPATGASEAAWIINLNNNDANETVKDIWYRLTVEDCDNGSPLESDPRIRNHGNE